MQMTSKERIRTALNWQEPDRVPIQIYLTPEIEALLSQRFAGRDLLDVFGVDLRTVGAAWRGGYKTPHHPVL